MALLSFSGWITQGRSVVGLRPGCKKCRTTLGEDLLKLSPHVVFYSPVAVVAAPIMLSDR